MSIPTARRLARMSNWGYQECNFRVPPATRLASGAVAAGAAASVNIWTFPGATFEQHVIGTQTVLVPAIAAGGLDVSLTGTADIGHELTQGITANNPCAFTVGTHPCWAEMQFTLTDVTGTDDCAFGFRKVAAYDAAIDNYTDFAVLNVQTGNIFIETALNNGATVPTDTTNDWADLATKALRVTVALDGSVTYKIDGVAPTTVAAFTFDAGDIIIPFWYFLHDTDIAEATLLRRFRAGLGAGP